jgi:hypothetical protein
MEMRERNRAEWVQEEVAGCEFGDRRLGKRFEKLLSAMAGQIGREKGSGLES